MWKKVFRALIRFYLSRFPVRNGKGWLYEACQEKLLPPERHITIRVHYGFFLRLDLSEPSQRKIYFFGDYDERHELTLLRRILRCGDIFWDVGANIGFYTLTASRLVGPEGHVVSFEPAGHAWKSLTTNLSLNHSANVEPVQVAVSDTSGQALLHRKADFADGGASLQLRADYHSDSEPVPTTTLDQFLAQSGSPSPTLIKIDVEGCEGNVLRGGQKILQGGQPPLILVEMNDPAELGTILAAAGYRGAYLYRRRWYAAADVTEIKSRNMLWFCPDSSRHRQRLTSINLSD